MAKDKRPKAPPPTTTTTTTSTPAAPATTPSWPPFRPSLPVVDLTPEHLVQDKVVVLRSFFPRSLCRDYVSFLRELPLITTPGKPKRGDAVRVNDRFQIDDPKFADRLWTETGLKDVLANSDVARLWYVPSSTATWHPLKQDNAHGHLKRGGEVVGLNPNIRIYRYSPGQFFDAHCRCYTSDQVFVPPVLTKQLSRRRLQQSNPPNLNRRPTPSNNNLDPTPLPNLFGRRLVSPLIPHQSTPTLLNADSHAHPQHRRRNSLLPPRPALRQRGDRREP